MDATASTALNVANRDQILQMSAMFSTTNKWFGLAQMNLEAILADSQVLEKCCPGDAGWADCASSTVCGPTHSTSITEFWPTGASIAAGVNGECVCTLLKNAYPEAMRVQTERQAAMAVLNFLSVGGNADWGLRCGNLAQVPDLAVSCAIAP